MTAAAGAPPGAVAWARDLQVGYGAPLWPPVTLTVRAGERWAVLGRNGSGKSSFLRALLGLAPPWAGAAGRRRPVGYIAQRPAEDRAVPGRVVDWVAGGCEVGWSFWRPGAAARRRQAEAALVATDLAGLAQRPLAALSEGQRQRVWMARAIACRPAWLVLDEPTSAMDAGFERQMTAELGRWCAATGGAVVWAGHHTRALVDFCSHVWLAASGADGFVLAGPREAVLAAPGAQAALSVWGG